MKFHMILIIVTFSFWLGALLGRWDAKYGYEIGLRHGQNLRSLIAEYKEPTHD